MELWLQDPLTWTIYGMISSQLSDSTDMIALEDGRRVTVSTYVFETYNYRHKVCVWLGSDVSSPFCQASACVPVPLESFARHGSLTPPSG